MYGVTVYDLYFFLTKLRARKNALEDPTVKTIAEFLNHESSALLSMFGDLPSQGNPAVDNIAIGLRKEGVRAVRVGRPDKINRILEEITWLGAICFFLQHSGLSFKLLYPCTCTYLLM